MKQNVILTERQRDWIESQLDDADSHSEYTPDQDKDIRYLIENDVATTANLREITATVSADLELLTDYFYNVKSQPHGSHQWDDEIRPQMEHEMQRLGEIAKGLSDVPEKNVGDEVRRELRHTLEPLSDDLTAYRRYDRGELEIEEEKMILDENQETPEEFQNDAEELQARREALNFILGNKSWTDLFLYIAETPTTVQKAENEFTENQIGKRTWKLAAGQTLKGQYGLIKDRDWGYVLTRRGEAVLETYHGLMNNEFINNVARDADTAGAALHLLYGHFAEGIWDRPVDAYEQTDQRLNT